MSFLKKNYKIIIFIVTICIIILLTLFLMFTKKDKKITILSVPYEHLLVNGSKSKLLNIPLFINEKNSPLFNLDTINNVYLVNRKTNDHYGITIKEITNSRSDLVYEDKLYYEFDFCFELNFYSSTGDFIRDAYLLFEYPNDKKIMIPIGSVTVYFDEGNSVVEISNSKGIVNEIKDKKILCGCIFTVNCSENNKIVEINSLSTRAKVVGGEVKLMKDNNINYNDSIDCLTTPAYQLIGLSNEKTTVDLKVGKNFLFIPLEYTKYETITNIGFILKIEKEGIITEQVIYPFQYFKVKSDSYLEIKKTIYE